MNDIRQLIQIKWQEEQVPIIDGILFDNGEIIMMRYEYFDDHSSVKVKIDKKITLTEFLHEEPDMWTSVIELFSITWDEGGIKLVCGGGGFGADGFVAAIDSENDHLRWCAFFQKSNPFIEIKLSGSTAFAKSTYNQTWSFPILNPEQVTVTGKRWG